MLITRDLVLLNFPKTGSSFARKIIRQAYAARLSPAARWLAERGLHPIELRERKSPKIDEAIDYGIVDQHGTYRQIPQRHRDKQILTVTRNPISRYVSAYRYRWWAEHPPADVARVRELFPSFPDLSFEQYYEMMHVFGTANRLGSGRTCRDIGLQTVQFVQFYFQNPDEILIGIDGDLRELDLQRWLPVNIRFLHQENLNAELRDALSNLGFSDGELEFIDSAKRVNVTDALPTDVGDASTIVSDEIEHLILSRDRLLFALFPEYCPKSRSGPDPSPSGD